MSAVTGDKRSTLNPNYPSRIFFSQFLEFTLDSEATEVNAAQICFISPKKRRLFGTITAAVTFHDHIMAPGSLYERNFQTRRRFVIASFVLSLFVSSCA